MYFQIFEEKSENRKDIKKGRKPMKDLSHHSFLATEIFKFLRRIFQNCKLGKYVSFRFKKNDD